MVGVAVLLLPRFRLELYTERSLLFVEGECADRLLVVFDGSVELVAQDSGTVFTTLSRSGPIYME